MNTKTACDLAHTLRLNGFALLPNVFNASQVEHARQQIYAHRHYLKTTRPNVRSGHLAGFHRYPGLEFLHALISSVPEVHELLQLATGSSNFRTIGLSDITVNRSQPWHTDLLRGRFQHHLRADQIWGSDASTVYKVLVYLQDGSSLKIIPGSHLVPRTLDDDLASEPAESDIVRTLNVHAGDVILMDVRLSHCGSSEEELSAPRFSAQPKILISTVLGAHGMRLTESMEKGNMERLLTWDRQHADKVAPMWP